MDNPCPKTTFNQNKVANGSRLSDQNINLYQYEKSSIEDFSDDETICTAKIEGEEDIDLYQYDEEHGNKDFSGDESMGTAKGEKKKISYQYDNRSGNEDFSGDERMDIIVNDKDQDDKSMNEDQEPDDIPEGWKYVEVAGSFDHTDNEGGGGFVLRGWEGKALLAQAFPAPGNSVLFVEAYAFHKAMEEVIALEEEDVVFCLESKVVYDCIQRNCTVPTDISSMLKDCFDWCEKHSFRVFCWDDKELEAALWLSVCGKRSQQHCRWDMAGPWPPGLNFR